MTLKRLALAVFSFGLATVAVYVAWNWDEIMMVVEEELKAADAANAQRA